MTGPQRVIERAGSADLAMGSRSAPQQIGALLTLEAAPGFDGTAATRLLAERVRAVPRLRQRLVRVPPGCGRPVWADDPAFDAGRHVRCAPCPEPGDEQALLDAATAVVNEPLPRSRPLWAVVFVTGPAGDVLGMVVVLDHVVADGIGGLAVLAGLVDQAAPASSAREVPFPRRPPSTRELAADALRERLRALRRVPAFWRAVRVAVTASGGLRPAPAERCSLLRPVGPRCRVEAVHADLAGLRAAAHRCGGTVNDALLTAITGALRTLLAHRGESVDVFSVAVMVAARRTAGADRLGNEVVPLIVALPGADGPPSRRLERVAAILRARKATQAEIPLTALSGPLFRVAARLGLYRRYMRRQRRLHTLVSNMRGPDRPLSFAGAPIRAVVPIAVAEGGNITVSFEALSYAGTLTVAVLADPGNVPDLPVLTAALRAELHALTALPV
ncbi:wax ester/triacylglycerol synthase domain-containing protein [Planobispora siamensis]|uniref:diacylglycerol O-acyltransferase n=1 Tax=Planobispora siamensis TaxID=936338 RepID=A0A8J3SK65_9ACTN|nr:wax ester/triacylglycerol synthase domain-containing protein [Planobispora siamensis]GIH95782.1 diacylglycerol O-acyltransferase [Planobispora siamensis]